MEINDLKQFDLEIYKKYPYRKIVTTDGRPVRIICTDATGDFPVVGLVDDGAENHEIVEKFSVHGKCILEEHQNLNLWFRNETCNGWVIINNERKLNYINSRVYPSLEAAEAQLNELGPKSDNSYRILKISWMEE